VLPCTYIPTYPHDHHAPPASHTATPHSALASRSFSDQSSPRTLSPRRVHRPSSPPTAHQHHRWQVLPPLRTSLIFFLAADPTQRASSYVPLRVHRVTVAPTPSYVERVVHVAACSKMALFHSARERAHSSLLAVGRCLTGCVCVYSTAGCTAESSRAERGTCVALISLRGAELNHNAAAEACHLTSMRAARPPLRCS
jgi:hypothetical protein